MKKRIRADHVSRPSRSGGLTLIELLVALALGALLMAGAISLFISNRESYNVTSDMSRLQESARFALETMVRDIRMAGYYGCSTGVGTVADNIGAAAGDRGALWDPTDSLEGFDENEDPTDWSPSGRALSLVLDAPDSLVRVAGTDAITVRYMAPRVPDHFVSAFAANTVTVGDSAAFTLDGVAAIADCGSADLFQVDAIAGNVINGNAISRPYDAENNPLASPVNAVRYFVATNARGNSALFRSILLPGVALDEQTQELFEGVADLQFLYGIDTDADGAPDDYVPAGDPNLDSSAEWGQVVSVQIGLLVQTLSPIGIAATQNFPDGLLDQAIPVFADSFRRRVFSTTVAVRN